MSTLPRRGPLSPAHPRFRPPDDLARIQRIARVLQGVGLDEPQDIVLSTKLPRLEKLAVSASDAEVEVKLVPVFTGLEVLDGGIRIDVDDVQESLSNRLEEDVENGVGFGIVGLGAGDGPLVFLGGLQLVALANNIGRFGPVAVVGVVPAMDRQPVVFQRGVEVETAVSRRGKQRAGQSCDGGGGESHGGCFSGLCDVERGVVYEMLDELTDVCAEGETSYGVYGSSLCPRVYTATASPATRKPRAWTFP